MVRDGTGNLNSGYKWIADLTAAMLAANRTQDGQATVTEPLPALKGEVELAVVEGKKTLPKLVQQYDVPFNRINQWGHGS